MKYNSCIIALTLVAVQGSEWLKISDVFLSPSKYSEPGSNYQYPTLIIHKVQLPQYHCFLHYRANKNNKGLP